MTRDEAIEYLNTLYMAIAVFPNQQISLGNVEEMKESVSMAIKALEQESKSEWQHYHEILKAYSDGANEVLDKIRAEIEHLHDWVFSREEILRIIDKYKTESEGKLTVIINYINAGVQKAEIIEDVTGIIKNNNGFLVVKGNDTKRYDKNTITSFCILRGVKDE